MMLWPGASSRAACAEAVRPGAPAGAGTGAALAPAPLAAAVPCSVPARPAELAEGDPVEQPASSRLTPHAAAVTVTAMTRDPVRAAVTAMARDPVRAAVTAMARDPVRAAVTAMARDPVRAASVRILTFMLVGRGRQAAGSVPAKIGGKRDIGGRGVPRRAACPSR